MALPGTFAVLLHFHDMLGRLLVLGTALTLLAVGAKQIALSAPHDNSASELTLRKAIAAGKDTAEVHGELGLLLYRTGRFEEAVPELGRAAQLNPKSSDYSLKLASSLLALHRYQVALDLLRAFEASFGSLAEYQYDLGIALYGTRQYDPALAAFTKAAEIDPHMDGAYFFIGNTYAAMSNLDRATGFYRKALALNSANAGYYSALGKVLAELGPENEREAISLFRKALKLKPDDIPSKLALGKLCARLGDFSCARPLLEEVASHFPDEVAPHVILARIYTKLNLPDKAELERQEVKRIERSRQPGTSLNPNAPPVGRQP